MKDTKYIEKDLYAFSVDLFRWLEIFTSDGMFFAHPNADFNKIYKIFKAMQDMRVGLYEAFNVDGENYKEYKGETVYNDKHDMILGPSWSLLEEYMDEWKKDKIGCLKSLLKELQSNNDISSN